MESRKNITFKNLHEVCISVCECEECPGSRLCPRYKRKFGVFPYNMYTVKHILNNMTIEGQELLAEIYKQK